MIMNYLMLLNICIPVKLNLLPCSYFRSCPAHLEAGLTRAVLDEARANYLNHNTTSMSPTGGTSGETDGAKNDKFASSEELHPAHPSLSSTATSTKGSQGMKIIIQAYTFYHWQH